MFIDKKKMKINKRSSIEHNFQKTTNMYPNLTANISNDQQFRLKTSMKSKIISLLKLEKEN